jgi:hypothetical protein
MNRLPFEQQLILAVQAAALLALCLRFLWTGLQRTYVYFFGYLILALLQTAIPVLVPVQSRRYVTVWMVSESLSAGWFALIVLDEYSKVLHEMAGIGSVARRYIKAVLGLAVLVSLLLVRIGKTPTTPAQYTLVCDCVVMCTLLVFVLSSLVFLAYYPVPFNRNLIMFSIGFAVYLLAKAGALLVGAMRIHHWNRQINIVLVGTSTASLLFWLFTLNRRGEVKTLLLGRSWNPEAEKRILSKLHAINESLLRTTKNMN